MLDRVAPQRGASPGQATPGRWVTLLGGLVVACSGAGTSQRLADGSWKVQCVDQVERCLRQAARACAGRDYEITGGGKETKRYGGATGEQSVTEQHTLVVRCADRGGQGATPGGEKTPEPQEAPPPEPPASTAQPGGEKQAPSPHSERVCAPGTTQRCVGPGACEGGQSCKQDGSGYRPCDCGDRGSSAGDSPTGDPPASDESSEVP